MRTPILLLLLCLTAPLMAQVNIEVLTVCVECDYVGAHAYDESKKPIPVKVEGIRVDRFTVRPGETFVTIATAKGYSIHQVVKVDGKEVYSEAGTTTGTALEVGSDNQVFRK